MTKDNKQEVRSQKVNSEISNKTQTSRDIPCDIKRINDNDEIDFDTSSNFVLGYN